MASASTAYAQEPEPMTMEEFQREMAETSRGFDRLERDGERTTRGELESGDARLRRDENSPWPPADPSLSVDNWALAIGAAPSVSTAALIKDLKHVDLDLWVSTGLRGPFGGVRDVEALVLKALADQGWAHSPTAEYRLEVSLLLVPYGLTVNGERSDEKPNVLRIYAALEVPARVLRRDGPHHGRLRLRSAGTQWIGTEKPSVELLRTDLGRTLGYLTTTAWNIPASAEADRYPWAAWCQSGDSAERLEQFKASHRSERDELDSAIDLVFGFSKVDALATGYDGAQAYFKNLHNMSSKQAWSGHYRSSGRSTQLQNAPVLRHRVSFNGYERLQRSRVVWSAVTSFLERNALAWLGGRWVLLEGATFVDTTPMGLLTASDMPAQFRGQYSDCWTRLDRWLGEPSSKEMELHADAHAILAFLKGRERVKVPERVAFQLANRIAFAIEAAQIPAKHFEHWRVNVDGQSTFRLDSFGDARHAELIPSQVQDKVRAAIEAVEWGDPIALHAFEEPFRFASNMNGVTLPEAFSKRLTRPRPSGAGALASERVITCGDLAFDLVRYYAKSTEEGAMRKILNEPELNIRLNEIKVIEANYLPKAGESKHSHVIQWFWYQEEPKDWAELRAKLPATLPFKRIAEACEGAPDRLEVAEKLVEQAIEAAGK